MPSGVANQTEEVIEDNQTEEDNEEAVMIVNTLLSGGDVETNDEQIKLADYGEVADAKGREGKTRPVFGFSACQFRIYIVASESGAANGEYVGLSKVLEMNSHQKDEDGKK
nr:hypothetical protein BaRGS_018873 [Batillaria attramentaria]